MPLFALNAVIDTIWQNLCRWDFAAEWRFLAEDLFHPL
jgi:hypothetical protein